VKLFLLILAMVSSEGQVDIQSTTVKSCPSQEALAAVMQEKMNRGAILTWGATCDPLADLYRI
jgi:hypothetical protein